MTTLGADSCVLLTRLPLSPKGTFDLHVLGLGPAFILSQDQTHFCYYYYAFCLKRNATNAANVLGKTPLALVVL